jgi:hypothetical protein
MSYTPSRNPFGYRTYNQRPTFPPRDPAYDAEAANKVANAPYFPNHTKDIICWTFQYYLDENDERTTYHSHQVILPTTRHTWNIDTSDPSNNYDRTEHSTYGISIPNRRRFGFLIYPLLKGVIYRIYYMTPLESGGSFRMTDTYTTTHSHGSFGATYTLFEFKHSGENAFYTPTHNRRPTVQIHQVVFTAKTFYHLIGLDFEITATNTTDMFAQANAQLDANQHACLLEANPGSSTQFPYIPPAEHYTTGTTTGVRTYEPLPENTSRTVTTPLCEPANCTTARAKFFQPDPALI